MHAGRWLALALLVTAVAAAVYLVALSQDDDGVVWKADAERNASAEWASSRADPPGPQPCPDSTAPDRAAPKIRRVASPVAQGRYAYAITVAPGDDCHGERAELAQGNPSRPGFENRVFRDGDERWIAFQVRLGSDFDIRDVAWRVIAQFHEPGGDYGPPALSLDVQDGEFELFRADRNVPSDDTVELWHAPAPKGRWVRFLLHVRFSPDPDTGFVELYGNPAGGGVRQLLRVPRTFTMRKDANGQGVPLHARIGIYRDPNGHFGTETVYFDGYTVATTRAAAEGNAF
jgi:hypothetical protein